MSRLSKVFVSIVLFCVLPPLSANSQIFEDCQQVIPPFSWGGIDVDHVYLQNVGLSNASTIELCFGSNLFVNNPLIRLGNASTDSDIYNFDYLLLFSKPITSLDFIIVQGGKEDFKFSTECANINIVLLFGCNAEVYGDSIYLGNPIDNFGQGNGWFRLNFNNPIREFFIRGGGLANGSGFKICANSLNQAPLWAGVHGSEVVCGLGSLIFERYGWLAGPYTYTYTINGGTPQTFVTNEPLAEIPLSELFGGEPPPGQYTIELTEIKDGSGWPVALSCNTSHIFEVAQQPVAQFIASPSSGVAPLEVMLQNQSSNATNYEWFINESGGFDSAQPPTSIAENPVLTLNDTGVYEITLVASNDLGCADTTVQTVHVLEQLQVVIPNVFTPNNDGINDWFGITSNVEADASIVILNRWGNVVFEKEFVTTPNVFEPLWDGTSIGLVTTPGSGEAADGVYFYRLVMNHSNLSELFTGSISVRR